MLVSRRSLLRRGALAGAGLVALRGAARAAQTDVAVVGAGAAGLAAAEAIRRGGHSVVVLEARSRIGGRAFTDASLGPASAFDAGAQYIHWAERNPWKAIAAADGVRTGDDGAGWPRLILDGAPAPDEARLRRRAAFGRLSGLIDHPAGPDRSLAALAGTGDPALAAAATGLARLSLGEEADRVSAAEYDRLWAGDDIWVDGYGALVARRHAALPVRLSAPVTAIDWSGSGVALATSGGTLTALAAIVTVPVGVLAADAIRFAPALPAATAEAVAGLRMGAYTKIALALDPGRLAGREWHDAVLVRSGPGAGLTAYLETRPFGRPVAVLHVGGDAARELCAAGEAAAVAAATDHLADALGGEARRTVTGGRLAGWWSDPWSRGSYSLVRPGHLAARDALRRPVGGRLYFAGEATAGGGAMTVGGATLDGERAAAEVLRRLDS
ncbi:flavin monoamine oxidase family protein [Methylobacterium oryzihabitans]|uniref:Tryptophan 2-monooxygenase n=1 Tax=Methylobacterium oryzihabitans TaxID=2499852 RepID=A0A437PGY7_9HYPH|nr:NAD(P)/FAD-dependent oxidoreductase [Methylobacterium oryzihabitans]RVU21531.1 FAD-binding protein [Methylobacterium oryzihabitans]